MNESHRVLNSRIWPMRSHQKASLTSSGQRLNVFIHGDILMATYTNTCLYSWNKFAEATSHLCTCGSGTDHCCGPRLCNLQHQTRCLGASLQPLARPLALTMTDEIMLDAVVLESTLRVLYIMSVDVCNLRFCIVIFSHHLSLLFSWGGREWQWNSPLVI